MASERAGWILAGGQSRRMGTDKALMQVVIDQPLALQIAELLRPITGTVTLIGAPEKYGHLGIPVAPDLRTDCGPLAGIETALTATTADWNLIVACDLPDVPVDIISNLFELTDGADAVVPQQKSGKAQPLCALYHRRLLPSVSRALDAGIRAVHQFLAGITLRYLPVADEFAFQNLNTPEDLIQYRLLPRGRHRNG